MRGAVLGLGLAVAAGAGGLDDDGGMPRDLGPAPVAEASRWLESDQAPGDLRGRPWVLYCDGLRPDDLPAGKPNPADRMQLLEELRGVAPAGDLAAFALFDYLEPFEPRRGHRYPELEVSILAGSYAVGSGVDARRGGRSCREALDARFGVWPELREGDGVVAVVDRSGRLRLVGALDAGATRRVNRAALEAAVRAVGR
jgi:hypothetical protein